MTPMKPLALAVAMVVFSHPAHADTDLDKVKQQLSSLQKQVEMLQKQLAKAEQKSEKTIERTIEQKEDIAEVKVAKHEHKPQGIKIGGAVRTNYSHTSYDDDNKNRVGDFDFDIFRLNFSIEQKI